MENLSLLVCWWESGRDLITVQIKYIPHPYHMAHNKEEGRIESFNSFSFSKSEGGSLSFIKYNLS